MTKFFFTGRQLHMVLWTMFAVGSSAAIPSQQELDQAEVMRRSLFESKPETLPFSWKMDGTDSGQVLVGWEQTREEHVFETTRSRHTIHLKDPISGLAVSCDTIVYMDFPAVEWVLRIANDGQNDSPLLTDVRPADFVLPIGQTPEPVLHYADGSQATPADFRPRELDLEPGASHTFTPEGGRSSDGVMPYFHVTSTGQEGVILAVGWTGQWSATFARDDEDGLRFRAGMEHTRLRLHPGESIRTPSILMLCYQGDRVRGQNLWRQFMLRHVTPARGAKPQPIPIAASGATIGFNNVSEENQLRAIRSIAEKRLPVNTWWIDAGWSVGGFPEGMGTWEPDPARFPSGLSPVSDAVHDAGLQFLLWFEPERVMPRSWLRRNRPEWLLAPAALPEPLAYQARWRLLNLGNPEARDWAIDTISHYVDASKVDVYRQDFNMHPVYYWRSNEPEDRQGMREIRYVEGLYHFLDTLRQRHPELLIDNCASGGRRLDFEMMRRSVPLWRSDFCWDPLGAQCIGYALSHWLPVHGLGAVSTDRYDFRSGLGACATFAFDYYSPDAAFWPELADRIAEFARVQDCYLGDFYPLTPYNLGEDCWLAWQYDRPDSGRGIVQAFRRPESTENNLRTVFYGLEEDASYEVRNVDEESPVVLSGRELAIQGISITLNEPRSSAMYVYQKQGDMPPAKH